MSYGQPARITMYRSRRRRIRRAALLLVVGGVAAIIGLQSLASSSSPVVVTPQGIHRADDSGSRGDPAARPDESPALAGDPSGALGEADGAVPDGATVFDDGIPGVGNLDPDLLGALRQAASAAAADGIEFLVTSGWRSPEYQDKLLRDAGAQYGSEAEASRWVATPETSPHVSGEAIDIGSAGATWLSARGAAYGLCQIYGNEPWHYELRPEAAGDGCPAMYPDPTNDPRMQT